MVTGLLQGIVAWVCASRKTPLLHVPSVNSRDPNLKAHAEPPVVWSNFIQYIIKCATKIKVQSTVVQKYTWKHRQAKQVILENIFIGIESHFPLQLWHA